MAAPEGDGRVDAVRRLREVGGGLRQALLQALARLLRHLGGEERLAEERRRLGLAVARRGARPQEAVVPREVALPAVLPVAGRLDAVPLVRVDDELRLHPADPPQRLVELLRVQERHVHVEGAAQEEGRGRHLLDVEEGRREAEPQVPRLPGQPQLHLVLPLVVIRPVAGEVVGDAGPGHRGLEARRLRDDVVGEDPAVAPAAHAEAVGVGDARPDHVVDGRHDVLVVLVPPVRPDGAAVGGAAARRAARVGGDHGVAVPGEHLPLELEGGGELVGGAAVDPQDGGHALPRRVTRGQGQEAVHDRPVRARGLEALDAAERDGLQEVVVRAGEAAERAALRHRRDLGRLLDRALEHDDRAAGRHVERLHVALAGDDALDLPALDAARGRGAGCPGPRGGTARPGRRA